MSKKTRAVDESPVENHETKESQETREIQESKPKIPFMLWFEGKVREGKIRQHQDYALSVFFEKRGLSENETQDEYEKVFKSF